MRVPLLLCLVLSTTTLSAGDWPSWRGPNGNGIAVGEKYPTQWSATENVKWKTPLKGKAWSSPVVWGAQVWVTTATEDGRQLGAIAIDRESGRVTHDVALFSVEQPQYADKFNSYGL